MTLVFVPVFNIDGHERFGPNNRPNQRGPAEMGWRVTAQNLNLNRDYVKADAPEMVAMLRLLRAWDPILYADMHVTDGAKFQQDIAVMLQPSTIGPEALRAEGARISAQLMADLTAAGNLPLWFYPAFDAGDDPGSGISFGITLAPLLGRLLAPAQSIRRAGRNPFVARLQVARRVDLHHAAEFREPGGAIRWPVARRGEGGGCRDRSPSPARS